MPDRALIERLAAGVFDPPVAYRALADYHLDFSQLADEAPEADARARAEQEVGCCVVLGESGSGKSSLIAAVAARLSPTRLPVRVRGVTDDGVLTREGFALHIARETLQALASERPTALGRRGRRAIDRRLAARRTQTSASSGGSAGLKLPVELTAQLTSSAEAVMQDRDPVAIFSAIEDLVQVTVDHRRRLLLVVEDTDIFMPPRPLDPQSGDARARRFVDQVVDYLAREFPSSSLVAVNSRYHGLIPSGTLTTVTVPRVAPSAVGLLLEHYAHQSGLHIRAQDVIDSDALAEITGRYAEAMDLRRTLELVHKGMRKLAGEGRGDRLTADVLAGL